MTISRYNQRIKVYPDGHEKITTFNFPVFNPHGLNTESKIREDYNKDKNITRDDSIKRGIDKIYDIAMCNEFDYFVTFTLDSAKVDRFDYLEICKKLKNWLNNSSKRFNLMYLIVPELHKNGAVHFHGLIKGDVKLSDSGKTTKDGKIIYNLSNWSYGFTTCIPLTGERIAVARYICKYITKDTKKILGNLYYAGGGVIRNADNIYAINPYNASLGNEYSVGCTTLKVKYYENFSEVKKMNRLRIQNEIDIDLLFALNKFCCFCNMDRDEFINKAIRHFLTCVGEFDE